MNKLIRARLEMITRLKAVWIVLTDGRMAFNVVEDRRIEALIKKKIRATNTRRKD